MNTADMDTADMNPADSNPSDSNPAVVDPADTNPAVRSRRPLDPRIILHLIASWVVARGLVWLSYAIADARAATPRPLTLDQGLLSWDGSWYRWIAELGYVDAASQYGQDGVLRFFPLYPQLARGIGWLFGSGEDTALLVMANASALVAAGLLFIFVRDRIDEAAGIRAIWLLALYPASFVLVFGYSEPLFLVFAIGAMIAFTSERWLLAAALGLLATLTRSLGVLLAAVALIELLGDRGQPIDRRRFLPVVAPVLGLLAHLSWAQWRFGSFLAPFDAQRESRGAFREPITRAIYSLGEGIRNSDQAAILHFCAGLALLTVLVQGHRYLRRSEIVWAIAGLILGLGAVNINSFERYALSIVPLFIVLAGVLRGRKTFGAAMVVSAAGFVLLCVSAFSGTYVP